jgi:hypothetical protein
VTSKVRVVVGALGGACAFAGAAYFGAPSRSPVVCAVAAAMGLTIGIFTGLVSDGWR